MSKRIKALLIGICLLVFFIFFAILGILFYVHSDHAGRQIQARINDRIPGKVIFKDYTLAMNKGRIELGNILLEDPQGRVVAGIDQLVLQVLWKELFYRNIAIEQIFIKNPQVRLIADPDGSLSLLSVFAPQRTEKHPVPSEKPDKLEPSFNLVIHDFLLENGAVIFENPSQDLTAKLESIRLSFSGNLGTQTLLLDLSTGNGSIESPGVQTRVEALKLSGAIQKDQINDLKCEIKTPSSNIELTGSARNILSEPKAELIMDIALHVPEIREAFFLEKQYTGNITGHLSAKGLVKNPEISLTLTHSGGQLGDFTMEESSIQAVVQDRIVRLAPMELKFVTGSIRVNAKSDLSAVFPEGFMVQPESFESLSYDFKMVVNDVNLKDALGEKFEGKGHIEGTVSAKGNGISAENAVADLQLNLSGFDISTGPIAPIDIRINSTAGLHQGEAVLNTFKVRAGPTELSATARFDIKSNSIESHIKADSKNLTGTLAPLGVKGAQGAVNFEAKATGTLENLVADLQLTGENLATDDMRIGNINIFAKLSEGNLLIQKSKLENQMSRMEISGNLGIFERHGLKPLNDPTINLAISADPVFLENFIDRAKAKVFLNAQIDGNIKNPTGNYDLKAEDIDFNGQNLKAVLVKGNLGDEKIHFTPFQILFASDQSIDGSGWISIDKKFQFQLSSEGIFLNQINKIRKQNIPEGMLVLNIKGEGNLDDPRVTGRMAIEDLTVNQKDFGNFQLDLKISDFLAIASGRLNFDFSAAYHLNKKDFTIDIDFDDTDLSPYFNLADLKDFSGKISGKMRASGNISDIKQTKGSGNFLFMNFFMKEQELVHAENFEIVFRNNQLLIPGLNIRLLEGGNLNIEASADLDGPLRVKADGTIPLEGLQMVKRALPDISGLVQISADVGGTTAKPDIQGEILLDQIGFTIPELLQKVHGVRGKIVITPEALKLEKIQGRLDTGRLELVGNVTLKDLSPEKIKLDLTASALPVKVPDTLNVLLQSNLSLSGTPEKAFLEGDLIILEGVYYKDIDVSLVEGVTQRRRQIAPQEPQATHPMLKNLNLDVSIHRRNPFWVDNNLAYLDINPDIRLTGTADQPLIQGRTTIESGTIQYQRKTFTLQKGVIDFINPYELEPIMDIESTVKIRKWLVTMTLYGTPDNMVLTLTSDPPEEDGDILSLLILGKTTRELISSEGGTSRSAEQMAAELIADTLAEDIKKITGLDFFEVETERDDEPEEESEGVMVTIGKKLSDRLTVKYALDSRTGDMIQRAISEYQLLENIILSAFQDSAGIFGGELQYRLEFR
jgi:autotransporter translocation and assembly factor TamB